MTGTHTVCVCFATALWTSTAYCQRLPVPIERLRATPESVRINAFYSLVRGADAHSVHPSAPPTSFLAARARTQPELGDALLDLLKRENEVVAHAPRGSLSGDYFGIYYMDLVVTVARMQDRRSAAALIHGVGASDVVRSTLAGFGDDAVPPLIQAFDSDDRDERSGAVLTARRMLAQQSSVRLTAMNVTLLKSALLRIAESANDAFTRMSAVNALEPLDGGDIRGVMQRLAAADTATGYAPPGHARPLSVRVAAQHWLAAHP